MVSKQASPYHVVAAVFILLLLLYTGYDKATKSLQPEKLVSVLSFQDAGHTLKELNKVFALEAIGLISIVFLLGPLSKIWPDKFRRFLYMRKTLGLTGFALAALHGIYSFATFYDLSLENAFFQNPKMWGIITAVLSLIIFLIMSLTSSKEAVVRLGYGRWKALQTFGYVGLLLALLHFFLLETKPDIGLDVRPFGLLFFYLPLAALGLRTLIIFIKAPSRRSYEEHIGERPPSRARKPAFAGRKG